jgi:hypothetical protein
VADKTIDAIPAAGALSASDLIMVLQTGIEARRSDLAALRTWLASLSLAGGTVTGSLAVTGNITGSGFFFLNRGASDFNSFYISNSGGAEVLVNANGNTEGNIRTTTNHPLSFSANNVQRLALLTDGTVRPGADNAQNLGSGSFRFATVFAGTGTINTSDAREKQNILPITDALLDKWSAVEAISYRFKDAVERKGDAARMHFGYTAQQVEDILGEDAWTYALLCRDPVTTRSTRKVVKAVQRMDVVEDKAVEVIEGVPTLVLRSRTVPAVELRPIVDGSGVPVLDDAGSSLLHPVPVMIEAEVEETVEEPAGDRLGLRYDQCAVIEAAWARRELSRALARIAALEAA